MVTIRCRNTQFSNIAAVVFDKDGTLADVERYLRSLTLRRCQLLNEELPGLKDPLLRAFGVEGDRLNPAGLMAVGSRRENEIAAAAYVTATGCPWLDSLRLVQRCFRQSDQDLAHRASQTPPLLGIPALIQQLADAGLKLAVLSSDTPPNIRDFLETYQLHAYFQVLGGAEPGKPEKPDPTLLDTICEQLAVTPVQTIMIGDAQGDLAMAAALGAGAIGVRWGWPGFPPPLEGTVVVDRPEEIEVVG
ncbi:MULTISPECIES: HAD family hydrolase [unclassified Leptolyngbya]|uniref:HAD family hydrolase n=1 Tax=unclassified Leptolyngbya TaxID=2650499 RepID=UPI0016821FB9|nr:MULTISPECIES: HAD family hydrolase [unclassified Leptolyngbya]MBD1912488.1 HAD family hydrolase [Leptolyngbya sp. FACHB-8]MBD2156501.1 HAD family hydrolase [Leptolyngbya sp. FACHB-16]